MPRIEIIPANHRQGDGSPTVDVCAACATWFPEEGESMPADVLSALAETANLHYDEDALVGSTDVEHPPFDDEEYDCDCCGKGLSSDDD